MSPVPARVLILQHQEDAPAGLLLDVLRAHGLQWQVLRVDLGESLPDPRSVGLAVSLGSDEAVDDTEVAWVARELFWLRQADGAGIPILGVCFGAQALSVALGGGVSRASQPERGWIFVESEDTSLIAPGPWQGWHQDTIELAPGAEILAHNSSGVQAFRHGAHLGVQFHPEVTEQIVRAWAAKHSAGPLGPVDPEAYASAERFQQATANAYRFFDSFLHSLSLSTPLSRSR
jgi:GMP synthase-like glutamine amidotransferase